MNDTAERLLAVQKLTALWAFAECGLGGMMHALKLPFTGLLVGGFAVIILSLIGWYSNYRFRIIVSATFIVILVKAILSPHTPFPAYFSVAFQGLLAALLFAFIRSHRMATLMLCTFALAQSALQKMLIITLFYGNSIWHAVDELFKKISAELDVNMHIEASLWLIGMYLGLHLIAGAIIGTWAGKLPLKLNRFRFDHPKISFAEAGRSKPKPYTKAFLMLLLAVLISVVLYAGKTGWLNELGLLLIRLFLITGCFYIISRLVHYYLLKKSGAHAVEVRQVIQNIPAISDNARFAYQYAKTRNGLGKLSGFLISLIALSLETDTDQ